MFTALNVSNENVFPKLFLGKHKGQTLDMPPVLLNCFLKR